MNSPKTDGEHGRAAAKDTDIFWFGLTPDENDVLIAYRKAKQVGFADLEISIQDGKRIKLWLTEKWR